MSAIDDYLTRLGDPQRVEIERIRRIVHEIVPGVQELIRYHMPTFKHEGQYLLGIGVFKKHLSLFPGPLKFTAEAPLSDSAVAEFVIERLSNITYN